MDFWSQKTWTFHLIKTPQNGQNYIKSHSKFVIEIQFVMLYKMINSYEEFVFENLNHLIVKDFWMVKIDHIFISPYELQFLFVFQFLCPKSIFFESFKLGIIPLDFLGFPFRIFNFKNDINYIKYKSSHKFGKVCIWLNVYYSNIRMLTF